MLSEAIERRGSSVDDYLRARRQGDMQNYLNVYGRTGKPCPRCGRPTRRITVNAREHPFLLVVPAPAAARAARRIATRPRSSAADSQVMAILRLTNVRREIGDFVILDSITAAVAHGERIGLVGANGAGKTTLLRLAAGRDEPDMGVVTRKMVCASACWRRRPISTPTFARADACAKRSAAERRTWSGWSAAWPSWRRRAAGVESAEYAHLRDDFEARGGYTLDVRVDAALSGLGFDRRRLAASAARDVAVASRRAPRLPGCWSLIDLLMLDEPTNHLDVTAIEWLETALVERRGALIVPPTTGPFSTPLSSGSGSCATGV